MSDEEFNVNEFISRFTQDPGNETEGAPELIERIHQSQLRLFAHSFSEIDDQIEERCQQLEELLGELNKIVAQYRLERYLVAEKAIADAGNVWCVHCGEEVPPFQSSQVYIYHGNNRPGFPFNPIHRDGEIHLVCSVCLERHLTRNPRYKSRIIHVDATGQPWIDESGKRKPPVRAFLRRFPRQIPIEICLKYCIPPDTAVGGSITVPYLERFPKSFPLVELDKATMQINQPPVPIRKPSTN